MIYLASGVPRLAIGTALILWRPTELSAMLGVFLGAIIPVVLGAYALRRKRAHRPCQRAPLDPPDRARDPRQRPDPAGVPVPDQHRRDRRPQRPRRARRRSLRRRPDPHQGDAVPSAVRGGGGVPVDVDGSRTPPGPDPWPDPDPGAGGRGCPRVRAAAAAGPGLHRRFGVRRGPGPALAVRRARHRALAAPAADLLRAGPPGHQVGLPGLVRAGGAARRRPEHLDRPRPAAGRHRRRHRLVPHPARHQLPPPPPARSPARSPRPKRSCSSSWSRKAR